MKNKLKIFLTVSVLFLLCGCSRIDNTQNKIIVISKTQQNRGGFTYQLRIFALHGYYTDYYYDSTSNYEVGDILDLVKKQQ